MRLIPYQIGRYGQLQEWSIDFEEATPGQRHMSHMYPLYPGNPIGRNFGTTAAIAELLLQSHEGTIGLFPRFPPRGRKGL